MRPANCRSRGRHAAEAGGKIANQIIDGLESDVKAERGAGAGPFGRRPIARRVEWNDEALKAAPRIPHAEVFEAVEKCRKRFLRHRLQNDREEARRARKVAFPKGVPRMVRKSRMQHAVDPGPVRSPLR